MSAYQVRRSANGGLDRWLVHMRGMPNWVVRSGFITQWGAKRWARRQDRLSERARQSYDV